MQIEDVRSIILSYPHVVERQTEKMGYVYEFQDTPFACIQKQSEDIQIGFAIKASDIFLEATEYVGIKRNKRRRRYNTYISLHECNLTLLRELVTEAYHQVTIRSPRTYQPAYAATIGCFDGVHKGHQFLLEELKKIGREKGLRTMAITFDPSPFSILHPERHNLTLTSSYEKERLIYELGIDEVYILRLNKEKLSMSAFDFMRNILSRQLNIKALLLGHDHTFGSDRPTSRSIFNAYGKQLKIDIFHCSPYLEDGVRISSSGIKQALLRGEIELIHRQMGHPHQITGCVTTGHQIGRRIGFPTANLTLSAHKLLPPHGVYVVKVTHDEKSYNGILNIGIRPTIDTEQLRTIEVHIFDFQGDLYGQQLHVDFLTRLRDEQQFTTLEALQAQIQEDKKKALTFLSKP